MILFGRDQANITLTSDTVSTMSPIITSSQSNWAYPHRFYLHHACENLERFNFMNATVELLRPRSLGSVQYWSQLIRFQQNGRISHPGVTRHKITSLTSRYQGIIQLQYSLGCVLGNSQCVVLNPKPTTGGQFNGRSRFGASRNIYAPECPVTSFFIQDLESGGRRWSVDLFAPETLCLRPDQDVLIGTDRDMSDVTWRNMASESDCSI